MYFFVRMKTHLIIVALMAFFLSTPCFAQQLGEQTKEQKEIYDIIQSSLDAMVIEYKLDDWQVFYLDSIMVHDYTEMQAELNALKDKKVSNSDMYYVIQDKWMEKMYNGFKGVLDEDQWKKYLRSGAERQKKARDKRAAKASK